MSQIKESFAFSNRNPGPDASLDNSMFHAEPFEESQNTQSQIEFTQLTMTQLTQPGLTPDESSNMTPPFSSNHTPLTPPHTIPFGRLVPCVPSAKLPAIDLMPTQESYWLGRSHKCDVTAQYLSRMGKELSKNELASLEWGKSMISNRHCRIFQQNNGNQIFVEDNSGNGTFINQQTHLRKGETRILHSGDEICLINIETLRKKISSYRVIQMVLQQFSFIFVESKQRKSCVNPRAMNYKFGRNHLLGNSNNKNDNENESEGQAPSVSDMSATRRIETFYDMREILGDGTQGQVRRAIHRQSGEERAVKIISLRRHVDQSILEREVKLLQSIDHPYIVKLVEVFVRHGVAMYIVMELVKGGDLFDSIVEKQRYTAVEARRAMRRLLSAVHYLHHEANIVHRDLKPENILCSSPTHVKLADFGLAKIVKGDGLKTFCGTPAYFAPEVLQRRHTVAGQGRYGKPADMWSLGVILYILLTGKPPFDPDMEESSKPFEVDFGLDGHIWSSMPLAKDLVEKMLCLDPKRRFTVRQACDHSWINVDDGDTHCHPLNDPAVGTKKNALNQEDKTNDLNDADVGANAKINTAQGDSNDSDSPCSKDDIPLSKKEPSTAVSGHGQSEDEFRVDDTTLLEPKTPPTLNIKTIKFVMDKNDEETPNTDANGDEGNQNKNEHIASVTSSDNSCLPPRSPLTKLNFNQRSNEFRNRVIKEANPCPPSLEGPDRFESPNGNGERQVPVTPTSNNVKLLPEPIDGDEKIEDPIFSQFSSVSSVESFSDSSVNENSKADELCPDPSTNKRLPEEDTTISSVKSPKRAKTRSSKQTTLNAWFVKKG